MKGIIENSKIKMSHENFQRYKNTTVRVESELKITAMVLTAQNEVPRSTVSNISSRKTNVKILCLPSPSSFFLNP
jgi:SRSO17 transposase